MNIYNYTVHRIHQLCSEHGITLHTLSRISGIPSSTLRGIMKGRNRNPGIMIIKKICDGFNITLTEFFDTPEYRELEQEVEE